MTTTDPGSVALAVLRILVYRPERVVRRLGTEVHRTLPSRVGGALYYREQA